MLETGAGSYYYCGSGGGPSVQNHWIHDRLKSQIVSMAAAAARRRHALLYRRCEKAKFTCRCGGIHGFLNEFVTTMRQRRARGQVPSFKKQV